MNAAVDWCIPLSSVSGKEISLNWPKMTKSIFSPTFKDKGLKAFINSSTDFVLTDSLVRGKMWRLTFVLTAHYAESPVDRKPVILKSKPDCCDEKTYSGITNSYVT